jgi:hypothetical protein
VSDTNGDKEKPAVELKKRDAIAWMLSREPFFRRTQDSWNECVIKTKIKNEIIQKLKTRGEK